jgi:PRTRC genetic system protein B
MDKKIKHPSFTSPEGCEAALFFLEGQYLFQHDGDGQLKSKFVSPAAVARAFRKEAIDSGWLPQDELKVMRWGTGSKGAWMVGYKEPSVYSVLIASDNAKPQKLRLPMPAFVWIGQKHNYFIIAVKGKKFDPKADLYHAPLPNVGSSGLICFGKNPHPDVAKGGFEGAWRTFWEAPFNDHQDNGKSRSHRDHVLAQLRKVAKSKAKAYPADDLVRFGSTLEQVIEKLASRGNDNGFYEPANNWMGEDDGE